MAYYGNKKTPTVLEELVLGFLSKRPRTEPELMSLLEQTYRATRKNPKPFKRGLIRVVVYNLRRKGYNITNHKIGCYSDGYVWHQTGEKNLASLPLSSCKGAPP